MVALDKGSPFAFGSFIWLEVKGSICVNKISYHQFDGHSFKTTPVSDFTGAANDILICPNIIDYWDQATHKGPPNSPL